MVLIMSDKDNAENYTERALKIFSSATSFVITIFRVAVIFHCHFQRPLQHDTFLYCLSTQIDLMMLNMRPLPP